MFRVKNNAPLLSLTCILVATLALVVLGCSQPAAAPTAAPTKAAAPAAAPAQPTAAPAQPAAAPTKAPEPAKVAYPTKPITVIVPWAAGGPVDTGARIIAPFLEKELGQPLQIVNKAGASGQTGTTELAQAKPDGYTLGIPGSPTHESNYLDSERKAVYKRSSFVAVANQVTDPNTFTVQSDSPYKTLADLLKAAKEKPNTIITGDSGLMTDDHQALLVLQKTTGTQFSLTHFEGGAPAQQALHGGHIQLMVGNIGDVVAGKKSGQFRVLAIASEKRSDMLPDVPTFKEQGVDLVAAVWRGWLAPAGTPADVVAKFETAMKKIDATPEYREKMLAAGLPINFVGSADYDKYLQQTEARVSELLQDLKKK